MLSRTSIRTGIDILSWIVIFIGGVSLILAPLIGGAVSERLWAIEPLAVIGAILVIAGLAVLALLHLVPRLASRRRSGGTIDEGMVRQWAQVTLQHFELFDHDLARPLRRILGKERELRAVLLSSEGTVEPAVKELLDEIERQTPNFRLMMSNIRVLVELETPHGGVSLEPIEPSEVVRKIVDRYTPVGSESQKEITWWAEPAELGIVYSDSSAIEHITTNLVDNAVRFANAHVEVKITKNPSHFFIRVWDDGPGIAPRYLQHVFDRGWTPEVARREEKPSSGLGLFIARTLANRYGGELTVESVTEPDSNHHTAFLLSLPLGQPGVTLP